MTVMTEIRVSCDVCEEFFIDDPIEDPDDVEYAIEREGGAIGLEINGNYYEHVCENCNNEVSYCEVCDNHIWSDDTYWCEDLVMCSDCVEHSHIEMLENGTIEIEENMCTSCDWEFPEPAKDIKRVALVTL